MKKTTEKAPKGFKRTERRHTIPAFIPIEFDEDGFPDCYKETLKVTVAELRVARKMERDRKRHAAIGRLLALLRQRNARDDETVGKAMKRPYYELGRHDPVAGSA